MASFTCHVVGGTKRVRVERTVRRDHATKVTRPASRMPPKPAGPWRALRTCMDNVPEGMLGAG
jgi:hypothetical protein